MTGTYMLVRGSVPGPKNRLITTLTIPDKSPGATYHRPSKTPLRPVWVNARP